MTDPTTCPTFTEFLKTEYERRTRVNPRYSIRAFAKALRSDSSTLSRILRGMRHPSPRFIRVIGNQLGCDPRVIDTFIERQRQKDLEAELAGHRSSVEENHLGDRSEFVFRFQIDRLRLPEIHRRARAFGATLERYSMGDAGCGTPYRFTVSVVAEPTSNLSTTQVV
jgi:transcriptional regulator with XRE-family HTH domain